MQTYSIDRAEVRANIIGVLEEYGELPEIDRQAVVSLLSALLQPLAVQPSDAQLVVERARSLEVIVRALLQRLERLSRPKIRKLWSNLD